jgi:hypothetical protein
LPSFSAMKFVVLLVELPLASFFSIAITSCLTGLSERQTLPPVGRLHRRGRLLRFLRREIDKLELGKLFPDLGRLHHFVKADDLRVGALGVEE